MTRSGNRNRATKRDVVHYSRLGGLTNTFEAFRSGSMTLYDIGEVEGVSRGTVRNDMIREFGKKTYDKAIETLYPRRIFRTCSISEAIAVVRQSAHHDGNRRLLALAATLERISHYAPTVTATNSPFGSWAFELNGRPLYVRPAIPEERHKEFALGLYRLKVSPADVPGVVIIALCAEEPPFRPIGVYLFRTEEIDTVRSMHLRFARFGTRFKWEFGWERWALLTEVCAPRKTRRKRVSSDQE